ncbi:MAG: PKD domain-containing protein [Flavobacteriales bacterium]
MSVVYNGSTYTYPTPYCVYLRPTPAFTISQSTVCVGGCILFTDQSVPGSFGATIGQYIWNVGVLPPPPTNEANPQVCYPDPTPTAGIVPTLQVIADNGCAYLGFVSGGPIHVLDDPPAACFTGSLLVCTNDAVVPYNAACSSTSGSTTLASYHWSVIPAAIISDDTGASPTITYPGIGTYQVCLTVTNNIGCVDQSCATVEVFDVPDINVSIAPSPTCAGVPVQFNALVTPAPVSENQITWQVLDGNGTPVLPSSSPGSSPPPFTFPLDGGYQVVCVVTYSSGCVFTDTVPVQVNEPLQASFTVDGETTMCAVPHALSFTSTSIGAETLQWSVMPPIPPPGGTSNSPFNHIFTDFGNYTVTLAVSNSLGCSDSSSLQVNLIEPTIGPFFTLPPSACAGANITTNNFSLNIIPGQVITYHWDFGDPVGNPPVDLLTDAPPIWAYYAASIPPPPNTYPVTLTITTEAGCTASAMTQVTIEPFPVEGFGPVQSHCIGEPASFCATDQNADEYIWQLCPSCPLVTTTTPCVDYVYANVPFGPAPNDVICYDVTLTVVNGIGGGCSVTSTVTNAVCLWGPMADFDLVQTCIDPLEVQFNSTSYAADSLFWEFGDFVDLEGDAVDDAPGIHTPGHTYAEGSYDACLTVSADTSDCPHRYCQTIHIDIPSADLIINNSTGCSPLCVELIPNDPFNILWEVDFGNDTILIAEAWPPNAVYPAYDSWRIEVIVGTDPPVVSYVPYGENFFPDCVWYTAMDTYTITATATNVNGCTSTTAYSDTVEVLTPGNVAAFTSVVVNICPEVVITCTPNFALDVANWTYPSPAWTGIVIADQLHLSGPTGSTTVQVGLQGVQGNCLNSFQADIPIPTVPPLTISAFPATACSGEVVNYIAASPGVWSNFQWTGITPDPGPVDLAPMVFLANGDHVVCVDAVNAQYGCLDTACVTVPVFSPQPEWEVEVTLDPTFCTYTVCFTDVAVCDGCTYQWSFVDALTQLPLGGCPTGSSPACCSVFPAAIVNATLTVTAPNGCDSVSVFVDVLDLGDILNPWSWTGDTVNCAPFCATFTAFDPDLPGHTYNWAFDDPCDGAPANGGVVSHCFTCAGVFCPVLTITDQFGCAVVIPCVEPIIVLPYDVSVNYDPLICEEDTSIAVFNGAAPFGIDDIAFLPSGTAEFQLPWEFALTPSSTTQYFATASYAQCQDVDTLNVVVHPLPAASFVVEDGCQHDTLHYQNTSAISGSFGMNWDWRFGNDSLSTQLDPSVIWSDWGSFTDSLIVTSGPGCADTAVHSITIHPAPLNSMSFSPNCYEESSSILSTSAIPMGSIDSTWWAIEDSFYTGLSAVHLFSVPGFHAIALHTMSDLGCATELLGTIEIWPLPAVNFALSDTVSCVHDLVEFTDASTIPEPYSNVAWEWFINGLPVSTDQNMALSFVDLGSYDVGLVVISGNECSDTLASVGQITINPLPVAGFYPQLMHTGILQPEIQFVDTSWGGVQWAYDLGDGNHSAMQHPMHTYATFGTYVIEQVVTNIYGCLDTAYQEVLIDPDLLIYVPNVFTPDGDGVNDVFHPSLDGFAVREYNLTIWNRWGELIFETADEKVGWDGVLDGQEVQDGVYVWQVELHAYDFVGRRTLRGHVTVLR